MKLCMGLVEKHLQMKIIQRYGEDRFSEYSFHQWKLLEGKEAKDGETLFLGTAQMITEAVLQPGTPVICAGVFPKGASGRIIPEPMLAVDASLSCVINQIHRIFEEFSSVESTMKDAACLSHSVQGVVDAAVPFLLDNLRVSTMDFRILGSARKKGSPWGVELEDPKMNRELIEYMNQDAFFEEVHDRREPFVYKAPQLSSEMLCQNVFYQGETVCRLVHCMKPESDFSDTPLIALIADYIQKIYEITGGNQQNIPQSQLQYVFGQLINGQSIPEEMAESTLRAYDWPRCGLYLCLCIRPGAHNPYGNAYYCKLLGESIQGSYSIVKEPYIACLVNMKEYEGSVASFLERNIEFLRDQIFRTGISNLFTDLTELYFAWEQAQVALETGNEFFPSFWYHRFSERILFYLGKKAADVLPVRYLISTKLQKLQEYDAINQTEYTRTLRLYLQNHLNTARTAKDLYISRGTMNFRLSRIKKLADIDFADYGERLYLEISFALLEISVSPKARGIEPLAQAKEC